MKNQLPVTKVEHWLELQLKRLGVALEGAMKALESVSLSDDSGVSNVYSTNFPSSAAITMTR